MVAWWRTCLSVAFWSEFALSHIVFQGDPCEQLDDQCHHWSSSQCALDDSGEVTGAHALKCWIHLTDRKYHQIPMTHTMYMYMYYMKYYKIERKSRFANSSSNILGTLLYHVGSWEHSNRCMSECPAVGQEVGTPENHFHWEAACLTEQ